MGVVADLRTGCRPRSLKPPESGVSANLGECQGHVWRRPPYLESASTPTGRGGASYAGILDLRVACEFAANSHFKRQACEMRLASCVRVAQKAPSEMMERGDDTASAACTSILYRVCYDPPQ